MLSLRVRKHHPDARVERANPGDAGLDLFAIEDVQLYPEPKHNMNDPQPPIFVHTGVSVEIPEGFVGLLFERSSGWRFQADLRNKVGVIDSGFRGEIICQFLPDYSTGKPFTSRPVWIEKGTKIAQLVLVPVVTPEIEYVTELMESVRGERGLGSSGGH